MIYRHTQLGVAILSVLAVVGVLVLVMTAIRPSWISTVSILFLVAIAIGFGSLTVEVSTGKLRCWFGPGIARRQFELAAVDSVDVVRNRWFYGWGIRLTPHGWMYNVSGFEAVEIQLASGKKFRIGTDEPQQLQKAILQGVEAVQSDA